MQKRSKFLTIFDVRQLPYDFGRLTITLPLLLYTRPKIYDVTGKRYRKFLKGGAVIAANHSSFFDPLAVECAFWYRRKYNLAAEVMMDKPAAGFGLRLLNCVRVDRNCADLEAIRKCVNVTDMGRLLVIYPQGRIERSREITEIKPGTILIALKSGAPVVPLYIGVKKHWYSRMVYVIGTPMNCNELCTKKIPSMKDMESLASALKSRLTECAETYRKITGEDGN